MSGKWQFVNESTKQPRKKAWDWKQPLSAKTKTNLFNQSTINQTFEFCQMNHSTTPQGNSISANATQESARITPLDTPAPKRKSGAEYFSSWDSEFSSKDEFQSTVDHKVSQQLVSSVSGPLLSRTPSIFCGPTLSYEYVQYSMDDQSL